MTAISAVLREIQDSFAYFASFARDLISSQRSFIMTAITAHFAGSAREQKSERSSPSSVLHLLPESPVSLILVIQEARVHIRG